MPVAPELAAAAHVRDRVDAAALDPREQRRREARLLADAVRAVGREQHARAPVAQRALRVHERQRHLDAVVAAHAHLAGRDAGEIRAGGGQQRRARHRARLRVDGEVAGRLGPALHAQQGAGVQRVRDPLADRAGERQPDLAVGAGVAPARRRGARWRALAAGGRLRRRRRRVRAVEAHAQEPAHPAVGLLHVQRVAGDGDAAHDARGLGHEHLRGARRERPRVRERPAQHAMARRLLVGDDVDRRAAQVEVRDAALGPGEPAPRGGGPGELGQPRDVERELALHAVADDADRERTDRRHDDRRDVVGADGHVRREPRAQQRLVARRAARAVHALPDACVAQDVGRRRAGRRVLLLRVEEHVAVEAERRRGPPRAEDRRTDRCARRDVDHVQRRVLAAGERDAERDAGAVRGGAEVVDRGRLAGPGVEVGVDQQPLGRGEAVAHVQLERLGAGRALQVEQAVPGPVRVADGDVRGVQRGEPLAQRGTAGQRRERRARVGVLRDEPRARRRRRGVLEPAVGVGDRDAVMRVDDGFDPRGGRRFGRVRRARRREGGEEERAAHALSRRARRGAAPASPAGRPRPASASRCPQAPARARRRTS